MKNSIIALLVIALVATLLGIDASWRSNAEQRLASFKAWFQPAVNREAIAGRITKVVDGDTVYLKLVSGETLKIRLTEIDSPETDQHWGTEATKALRKKVRRKDVQAYVTGTDRYGRTLARLFLDDRDIHHEMVAEGHAWVYRQYMTDHGLLAPQAAAKELKLGLWSQPAIPPWEWRRGSREAATAGMIDTFIESAEPVVRELKCLTKKYCREMRDCEEAKFYLTNCGLTRLDGDNDGVPCERICN